MKRPVGRSKRRSCLMGCIVFFAFFTALGFVVSLFSDSDSSTEEKSTTPETITTGRGNLLIPGNAFMDGRDLEANPPLTIMEINVWNNQSRERVVCTLQHAAPVRVSRAVWVKAEERYYLHVKGAGCEGWVSDPFVSPQQYEPIGDQT